MIVNEVESKLKARFPNQKFEFKTKLEVYVDNLDFYVSEEFGEYLDELCKELSDDDYMNIEIKPAIRNLFNTGTKC